MSAIRVEPATMWGFAAHVGPFTSLLDGDADEIAAPMRNFLDDTDVAYHPSDASVHAAVLTLSDDIRRIDGWVGEIATAFVAADRGSGIVSADDLPPFPLPELPAARAAVLEAEVRQLAGTSPSAVAAWWNLLTGAEREHLLGTSPDLLANTDGIDVGTRDGLNRIALADTIDELRGRAAELEGSRDWWFVPDGADEREDVLARLAALEQVLATDGFVLLFDNAGDGRAAVAFGDPSTADHVSVHVPGISNDLDNVPGLLANARRLQDLASSVTTDSVSTIAWLGYDTPGGPNEPLEFVHAPTGGRAAVGAAALSAFQQGLHATGQPTVHTTVVGHSYGSRVTADAIRTEGLAADDYVLVGSPGAGVAHVDQLGAPAGSTVWAESVGSFPDQQPPLVAGPFGVPLTNPLAPDLGTQVGDAIGRFLTGGDPVPAAPSLHGRNPDEPGFGAEGFALGDAAGHSLYYGSDGPDGAPVVNESLESLATIVTGHQPGPPEDGS